MPTHTEELSLFTIGYNKRLRGTSHPPITLYSEGPAVSSLEERSKYLREPLKRQADQEPRQPWQASQEIHHKVQDLTAGGAKEYSSPQEKPFPGALPFPSTCHPRAPTGLWGLGALGRGPGTEGDPPVSGEKVGSAERRAQQLVP